MHDTKTRSTHHATSAAVHRRIDDPVTIRPAVDIVIPVYNEAAVLEASIEKLYDYLESEFPLSWRITIVDNASTDGTWFVAARLARGAERIRALHLDRKGRGLALRAGWESSDADVFAYMDVDLSTDLEALLPLVAPLVSGHSDVAIGSRLAPGASVARRPKRELISRCYNALLHAVFATRVSDAQCGFKALRADVGRRLVPAIEDDAWFFDTELLLLAERNGLRIHEVPVDWIDDADSRVRILRTSIDDLAGTVRMARTFLAGGGRLELGELSRPPLADDLGRALVSTGALGVAAFGVGVGAFVLVRPAAGTTLAGAVALALTAATAARLTLTRGRSRRASIDRSHRE